jgi:hypothetical protein
MNARRTLITSVEVGRSRFAQIALVSSVAVVVAMLLIASAAGAATTHPFTGKSFGPEGPDSETAFQNPQGVAIDEASHDVLVFDAGAGRIYKFGYDGEPAEFSATGTNSIDGVEAGFTGENQIAVAPAGKAAGDIYFANGSTVKIFGSDGSELGELSGLGETCGVAANPAGDVFVGSYPSTVHEFVPSANPVTAGDETASSTASLPSICDVAADGVGQIYAAAYSGSSVARLSGISDATGSRIEPGGTSLAIDPSNNDIYINRRTVVAQYNAAGGLLGTFGGARLSESRGLAVGGSTGEVFVANGKSGRVEVFGPGEPAKPVIESESVETVDTSEGTVQAQIDANGVATTGYVEYGTDGSYGHRTAIESFGASEVTRTASVTISGLSPATHYHFRFVAEAEGSSVVAGDHAFTTETVATLETDCPNQALRIGVSGSLPDCRAYEMVSPIDKNGGDVTTNIAGANFRGSYDEAALEGGALTYSAGTAFAGQADGRNVNQYLATRTADGWSTQSLNLSDEPILGGAANLGAPLEPAFKLFSDDLSEAWINDASVTPRTPGAAQGVPNLYKESVPSGQLEALTNQQPALTEPESAEEQYRLEGVSADHQVLLFSSSQPLTEESLTRFSLFYVAAYVSDHGHLRLASVKPSGQQWEGTTVHTAKLSSDGWLAYWGTGGSQEVQGGPLFLRENPGQAESAHQFGGAIGRGSGEAGSTEIIGVNTSFGEFRVGQEIRGSSEESGGTPTKNYETTIPAGTTITEVGAETLKTSTPLTTTGSVRIEASSACTEPTKACTVRVSELVPHGYDAELKAVSEEGHTALYVVPNEGADELYQFDQPADESTRVAGGVIAVVGVSDNGARAYFVSTEVLDGAASTNQPNLYLDEQGHVSYIATLLPADVARFVDAEHRQRTTIGDEGQYHGARISSDGSALLFMSQSQALSEEVAGYDNSDAQSSESDREIYLFRVGSGLVCVSCNPTGARPHGQLLENSFSNPGSREFTSTRAAAWIPGEEHPLLAQRVLSASGNRVFFNAYDSLSPADENGAQDVYEWESPGTGRCTAQSASFSQQDGGCVNLISGGQNASRSEFIDASANGDDVYFSTAASLLPQDPGLVDIYDARVDGGFPAMQGPAAECEGEACQSAPRPPADATPASTSFSGPGNLLPALVASTTPKKKTASATRAQKLAKALKACKTKAKAKRKRCEAAARKRYGPQPKSKPKKAEKTKQSTKEGK